MGSEPRPLYHTVQWSAFLLPMWRSPVQISALRPAILAEVCTVFLCPPTWMLGYKFGLLYNDQWIMDGKGCWKCPWPHFRYICLEILNFLWSWGLNSNCWQDEKDLNLKYPSTHLLARYIVQWLTVTKRLWKASLLADICTWDLPNANQ